MYNSEINENSNMDENLLSRATLHMFYGLNVDPLSPFYKCRFLSNYTKKIVVPLKGAPEKVINGEFDKKTKGPF